MAAFADCLYSGRYIHRSSERACAAIRPSRRAAAPLPRYRRQCLEKHGFGTPRQTEKMVLRPAPAARGTLGSQTRRHPADDAGGTDERMADGLRRPNRRFSGNQGGTG